MIQSLLLFLAPAQPQPVTLPPVQKPSGRMATRSQRPSPRLWMRYAGSTLAVALNSLGLMLFLAGLWLVLRLAEVLLT